MFFSVESALSFKIVSDFREKNYFIVGLVIMMFHAHILYELELDSGTEETLVAGTLSL